MPLGNGVFYSGWYQIQASLLEENKVVNYSISQAWWMKSSPLNQEVEVMSGGYGDFHSTLPKLNFSKNGPSNHHDRP